MVNQHRIATQGAKLRAQLIRGGLGVSGLQMLSLLLGLIASVVVARSLGPGAFGQYAFIMSVVTVLALPLNRGMQQLITREVAGYCHGSEWSLFRGLFYRANQWVLLGAALIIAILGPIAAMRAAWSCEGRWTLLLVALAIIPFLGLSAVRSATLRGLGHVVQAQLPELLVQPLLNLLIVAVLVVLSVLNPATALLSQTLATAVAFSIGVLILRRYWPTQAGSVGLDYQSRAWVLAWGPFTLLAATGMLNGQIGILLLGWLGMDEEVAALRVADRGAQLVALSLIVVNLVIGPYITHAYRDGNRRRLQQLFTQSARIALAIALPVGLPLIFFGSPIIELVFGAAYADIAVTPLAVLAAAQLVNVAFGSVGNFLTMSGYERDSLFSQMVALALNVLAALALIPAFGADGAAYASAIGLVTSNLVLATKVVRRLGIRPLAF